MAVAALGELSAGRCEGRPTAALEGHSTCVRLSVCALHILLPPFSPCWSPGPPAHPQAEAAVAIEAKSLQGLHARVKLQDTSTYGTFAVTGVDSSGSFSILFSVPPPIFFSDARVAWKRSAVHVDHPIWSGECNMLLNWRLCAVSAVTVGGVGREGWLTPPECVCVPWLYRG